MLRGRVTQGSGGRIQLQNWREEHQEEGGSDDAEKHSGKANVVQIKRKKD